jgi:hypothetical protein
VATAEKREAPTSAAATNGVANEGATEKRERKEVRLASPTLQLAGKAEAKLEDKGSVAVLDDLKKGTEADMAQRPQRWGFWRGNR